MTETKKPAMATWLKVTIGVVVAGFFSFVALLVIGGIFVADATKKIIDPQKISQVEQSIVQLETPLPRGFHRIMAIDVMGLSEAAYIHPRSGLEIIFIKVQKAPHTQSAEQMLQWYLSKGASSLPGMEKMNPASSPLVLQSQGHMTVGGEDMPYAVGNRTFSNIKSVQMIGVIVPRESKKAIVVVGQCMRADTYQMELTKRFLAAVKGF